MALERWQFKFGRFEVQGIQDGDEDPPVGVDFPHALEGRCRAMRPAARRATQLLTCFLAAHEQDGTKTRCAIKIADTILVEDGRLDRWLFTSKARAH